MLHSAASLASLIAGSLHDLAPIAAAVAVFQLLVVDRRRRVVGIVTMGDMVLAAADLAESTA